jgi:nucleotide-binding universal stress UspA family protein
MIKSILIPATGDVLDDSVLETALRVAQLAPAHIELRYFCERFGEVAETVCHVGSAMGGAALPALAFLEQQIEQQSTRAHARFAEICRRKGIALLEGAQRSTSVTASWRASRDDLDSLAYHARHADLIVMGRPGRSNGLTRSHLETALSSGGRPLLVAPSSPRSSITGTAFVCWKESPEAARALSAALPLLAKTQRIVVASVDEGIDEALQPLRAVARYLAFHGITAETRLLPRSAAVADVLVKGAEAHEADLVVLGAYGHSKARELVFGGCTRSFLDSARVPVLMMR